MWFHLSLFSLYIHSTISHGFLFYPGTLPDPNTPGAVRNIGLIDHEIDSLRNPMSSSQLCRGASKGKVTPIHLDSSKDFTLTLAFSNGAQHVGPCWVHILDAKDPSKSVEIASVSGSRGCAVSPIASFETDKASPASNQCPGKLPFGLVTNDMCLTTWTFKPMNVDKITCKECILRWSWDAQHISTTSPEKYENCADVVLSNDQSGVSSSPPTSNPNSTSLSTPTPSPTSNTGSSNTGSSNTVTSNTVSNVKTITSKKKHCICDLKEMTQPYFVCANKGKDYCVCFPGPYSLLPTTRMKCPVGTSCSALDSTTIECISL